MAKFMIAKAQKITGIATEWRCYVQRPFVSATVWDDSGLGTHKSAMLMRLAATSRYGVTEWKREAGRGSATYHGSNDREALPIMFVQSDSGEFAGDVTAIFPTLQGTNAHDVSCYAHIGQHGTASLEWYKTQRHCNRAERNALYHELRGIYENGDDPVSLYIVSHFSTWMHNARAA